MEFVASNTQRAVLPVVDVELVLELFELLIELVGLLEEVDELDRALDKLEIELERELNEAAFKLERELDRLEFITLDFALDCAIDELEFMLDLELDELEFKLDCELKELEFGFERELVALEFNALDVELEPGFDDVDKLLEELKTTMIALDFEFEILDELEKARVDEIELFSDDENELLALELLGIAELDVTVFELELMVAILDDDFACDELLDDSPSPGKPAPPPQAVNKKIRGTQMNVLIFYPLYQHESIHIRTFI